MSKKDTVLIIEGHPGFRHTYRDALESGGYKVLEAEDGESGWELAKAKRPDLIFLDLVLPRLNGFEVLKKIRADETTVDIPVIILSVLEEEQHIQKGVELGADGYMIRRFHFPREIASKIRPFLTKAHARV
jgi:DNA-binding response OmpR family regulator